MILNASLLLAILLTFTASNDHFGTKLFHKKLSKTQKAKISELLWKKTDTFDKFLADFDGRIDDQFKINPFYYPNVYFWFLIYTQFDSAHVLIHDKVKMKLIYRVLDFKPYRNDGGPDLRFYHEQQKFAAKRIRLIKEALQGLALNPELDTAEAIKVKKSILDSGIRIPNRREDKMAFYLELKENIRAQTGQKNFIKEGIIQSLPYQKFIQTILNEKSLPKELIAIPFLESSFNPIAESRVGALGVWQFMPLIASYYLPRRSKILDYRSSIALSSVAAAHLMAENYRIMKSWDLAVTSYNSGTKHLLKTIRKLKTKTPNLENIIRQSKSSRFGFASKNFYSEFLALVHTIAYEEELFNELHENDRHDVDDPLLLFVTKCSLNVQEVLTEDQKDTIRYHNHHLKRLQTSFPKGLILASKEDLPEHYFHAVSIEKAAKIRPKEWIKMIKNYSCSTR